MRTEIARQRLTPQVQSPPPSTHPPPSSALTTNNDSELVPGANNLIFRQLGNLDQLLNDALGTQTNDVVHMDTIFEKVRELIEENNEMRDFFKKNFGKIKPRDICAGQFSSVATQTPPVARHTGHARSGAQDSVLKASQTFDHQILVAAGSASCQGTTRIICMRQARLLPGLPVANYRIKFLQKNLT